jgi:hypothetical protein
MRLALAIVALAAAMLPPTFAGAQSAFVVADCAVVSGIPTGPNQPLVQDQTGQLCGFSALEAAVSTGVIHSLPYTDTATPLTGAATFTGTWRNSGATAGTVGAPWAYVEATFTADQAGTAYIDFSTDGATTVVSVSAALGAAATTTLRKSLTTKYWRTRFVNGGAAQATFSVTSAFLGN